MMQSSDTTSADHQEILDQKRARRRLVGTAVLGVLTAIFLPFLVKYVTVAPPAAIPTIVMANQEPAAKPLPIVATSPALQPAASSPAPAISPRPALPPAPPTQSKKLMLQAGAFTTMEKARALQVSLKKAGIASYTENISTKNGQLIRVRIGPFSSTAQRDAMVAKLLRLGVPAQNAQ